MPLTGNVYVDALAGTSSFLAFGRDSEITYHFDNDGSRAWKAAEKAGMRLALQAWANVADITFREVASRDKADISEKLYSYELMTILVSPDVTALHEMPSEFGDVFQGIYSITGTPDDPGFNLERYAITAGSRNLQIFIHEIGHALGLDHPHDRDVGTGVLPGVSAPGDLGTYRLNQNIFTVMSYNDFGKPTAVSGHAAGPMAFDIAAIQKLYGANTSYMAGNSVYALQQSNGASSWRCLWDAGGVDQIAYGGNSAAIIDLRPATLKPGPNAGGYLTSIKGVNGGFTIAHGVIIENASGGSGNDIINGNATGNILRGGKGSDRLSGLTGDDRLHAGSGNDLLSGGQGDDVLTGGAGADRLSGGAGNDTFDFNTLAESQSAICSYDSIADFTAGEDTIDLSSIDANTRMPGNQAFDIIFGSEFTGVPGTLRIIAGGQGVMIAADVDGDRHADFAIFVSGAKAMSDADFAL